MIINDEYGYAVKHYILKKYVDYEVRNSNGGNPLQSIDLRNFLNSFKDDEFAFEFTLDELGGAVFELAYDDCIKLEGINTEMKGTILCITPKGRVAYWSKHYEKLNHQTLHEKEERQIRKSEYKFNRKVNWIMVIATSLATIVACLTLYFTNNNQVDELSKRVRAIESSIIKSHISPDSPHINKQLPVDIRNDTGQLTDAIHKAK